MPGALAETIAIIALIGALAVAVWRPRGLSEAIVAVPAAALLVALNVVPHSVAIDRLKVIGPTVIFLAGILIFGHLCAEAGVFEYLGGLSARISGADPRRLLVVTVVVAALITAVLTLDATVVLLTPVVLATVSRLGVSSDAPSYACVRLANSGSLLLPVSNLTNLLAFGSSGLSFGRFAALMALPWVLACGGEWLTLRIAFRRDLLVRSRAAETPRPPIPGYALVVLGLTVAGFVVTSSLHINPAWAAFAGCALLLIRRRPAPRSLVSAASPGFCLFVLALAVIVDGVTRHGLGSWLGHLVPNSTGLGALLLMTFVARGAGECGEQPARHARAPDTARRRASGAAAGDADRRQRRAERNLPGVAGHVAVAAPVAASGRTTGAPVPHDRTHQHAGHPGRRDACPVGGTAGDQCRWLMSLNRRSEAPPSPKKSTIETDAVSRCMRNMLSLGAPNTSRTMALMGDTCVTTITRCSGYSTRTRSLTAPHAGRHRVHRLATRGRHVGRAVPGLGLIREGLDELSECEAFPLAEVQLGEVVVELHRQAECGGDRFGGLPGAQDRRADHRGDVTEGGGSDRQRGGLRPPGLVEFKIVVAGESASLGVHGRAVAHQVEPRWRHAGRGPGAGSD